VATHSGRRIHVIEVILVGVVAGAISCEGRSSRPAPDQAKVSALTAGGTATAAPARAAAAQEQAKADGYARQAAVYAQIASANRSAAACGAALPAREAAAAGTIKAPTRLAPALDTDGTPQTGGEALAEDGSDANVNSATSVDPAAVQRTLSGLATAATSRQADQEKAATLADRLAANALRASHFYQAKASAGGGQ
jgi:hypothetical protein